VLFLKSGVCLPALPCARTQKLAAKKSGI